MDETERLETEKGQIRANLENVIEKAKDACERLQNQTAAAAKATDKTIRDHPYEALGVAFGLGVLIGGTGFTKARRLNRGSRDQIQTAGCLYEATCSLRGILDLCQP